MATELIGAELDAAVARALGWIQCADGLNKGSWFCGEGMVREWRAGPKFSPSTDWSQGGPIIERERIWLLPDAYVDGKPTKWLAEVHSPFPTASYMEVGNSCGHTPLIAAMRAFVASKA